MKFKNTPISNINEVVINRTIQWKKRNGCWYRIDFNEQQYSTCMEIAMDILDHTKPTDLNDPKFSDHKYKNELACALNYAIKEFTRTIPHPEQQSENNSHFISHYEMTKRMHAYDTNQRRFKTWISGNTLNIISRKKNIQTDDISV